MPIFARILDEKYIKTFFMINPIVKTIELPDGRTITLETGKLAKHNFKAHFNPKMLSEEMDLESFAILKALNKKYK